STSMPSISIQARSGSSSASAMSKSAMTQDTAELGENQFDFQTVFCVRQGGNKSCRRKAFVF
ncbi:MAG: hypothetical protein LBO64_06415, partial [Desulfovibrio sp.]|nr:hypothetical protein [Desulfovibrio sp.]